MYLLLALIFAALALALLYAGRAWLAWVVPVGLCLLAWGWSREGFASAGFWLAATPFVALAALFGLAPLRRAAVTRRLMPLLAPIFPRVSETERIALEAGTVWWDAELFSGAPRWKKLVDFQVRGLSERERAFLEGPCEELCRMVDDWRVHQDGDLTADAWEFIKQKGFMGIIIPEEYGGLGFSAQANSAVVTKVSSHSVTAAVTVMVPNSLGPAELLHVYGTQEQKKRYLPRLARGEEVPCFALTEPSAGSDATAMTSRGVVCRGRYDGEEVLGMRLDWDKRYITLSTVATLIGLAFKLYDPDGLLGDEVDLGITCALVPADAPGVEIGLRHDPLGVPFLNGPTRGHDVFVPIDFIIGGPKMAGQGWRMLMDCLSAGRGISLPGLACGASQVVTRAVGAYASVREQFNTPIGQFEGIQERLAEIGGTTYLMDAARRLTAGAVDSGQKPAVISAIVKAWLTEGMRDVVNHGMDVLGGAGIVRGPRNVLAHAYQAVPIGITVEGANILTRSMIVFGQGALRCHAFALEEMAAAKEGDVKRFDAAFFGHVGSVFSNLTRAALLGCSRGLLARPPVPGVTARWFRGFERMSAAFAVCAEVSMMTLGGTLKRKEMLTGRLADGLAWMYLGTASLKRFLDEGSPERDLAFLRWSCETALLRAQQALLGLLENLPARPAALALRWLLFPFWSRHRGPDDRLRVRMARALLDGGEAWRHLTRDIHLPAEGTQGLGTIELALAGVIAASEARRKLREAARAGKLERGSELEMAEAAVQAGVLTAEEHDLLREAARARSEAIAVDAFPSHATAPIAECSRPLAAGLASRSVPDASP